VVRAGRGRAKDRPRGTSDVLEVAREEDGARRALCAEAGLGEVGSGIDRAQLRGLHQAVDERA